MEEGSLEVTNEEDSVLESNTPVENTETFEDLEEETEPPDVSEAVEEKEVEQDSQLSAEDMTRAEMSGAHTAEPEPELHIIPEEQDGADALTDDTLEDTEGPEMGHLIDDLLSREDTEDGEEEQEESTRPAPEPESARTSPANESEEEEPSLSAEEQTELLRGLQAENDNLGELNLQLQTKIAEYLSKNTQDKHPQLEEDIPEEEQYQKYMDLMAGLRAQQLQDYDLHRRQSEELQQQTQEKLTRVGLELRAAAALKSEAVGTAFTGKVGKQAALAKVEQLRADELKYEDKVTLVRLNNIKFKNKICQLETALRSKRKLADGLLLMDFEQLETENQACREKLKERREELLRLKRKVACSVQGISHVKEKLHFMEKENAVKQMELAEADAAVALRREALTHTRQARDGLRADNLRLQQRSGMLGNTTLLQDFEEKVDTSERLQQRLETLRRRHAELTLKCAGVKQKIKQSKPE